MLAHSNPTRQCFLVASALCNQPQKRRMQEAATGVAAANEISVGAAAAAVLSETGGEEQRIYPCQFCCPFAGTGSFQNSNKSDLVQFECDSQMVCPITIQVNICIGIRFVQVWIS